MELEKKRYVIGIDLGTTNSAVSYVELLPESDQNGLSKKQTTKSRIKIFNVPQLVSPGEIGQISVLPSFL